jgi:aminopeptidase-like protein
MSQSDGWHAKDQTLNGIRLIGEIESLAPRRYTRPNVESMSNNEELNKLNRLFDDLWPICRSIAGPGFRQSLSLLEAHVPFERLSFPTGTKAFDWTVPDEWSAREAWIMGPDGIKRADFSVNNLHLVSHSEPFRGKMPLAELKKHLHSLPELPKAIPYITSYYKRRWGFCLSHEELLALPEGDYEVKVDTELKPGRLEVAEAVLPGSTGNEVLLSTYLCHPSLANNELSGPLALVLLYGRLAAKKNRRFTYRFVVSAETIGTICYLSRRGEQLKERVRAGFQLTCLGNDAPFTLKTSRRGDSLADQASLAWLEKSGERYSLEVFDPGNGSDERQYCSPAFDLPVASLMRSMYARYPEYHTSLDDKAFLSFPHLLGTVDALEAILDDIDSRRFYLNTMPQCEPRLGPRGLYPEIGTTTELEDQVKAIMWLLNYSDRKHDLREISRKSKLPEALLAVAAEKLAGPGLLREL